MSPALETDTRVASLSEKMQSPTMRPAMLRDWRVCRSKSRSPWRRALLLRQADMRSAIRLARRMSRRLGHDPNLYSLRHQLDGARRLVEQQYYRDDRRRRRRRHSK